MERLTALEIFTQIMVQFTPVWIGLAVILTLSYIFRGRLGLYGKLFGSPVGVTGLVLVMFWVLTAIFADVIATMDPLTQISGMKNKKPGWPVSGMEGQWYLLGGDNLARDVFSRMVKGSQIVLAIAPAATVFAFMVGITLGLPCYPIVLPVGDTRNTIDRCATLASWCFVLISHYILLYVVLFTL